MCGRVDIHTPPSQLARLLEVQLAAGVDPEGRPSWNVPPARGVPAITERHTHTGSGDGPGHERVMDVLRWGLVPHWAPDLKFGNRCFNARSETLAKAPAFRAAFQARRCLVPMNAFYEWSGPTAHRTRHRIGPQGQPLFALAGLWERWGGEEDRVETFTIITCEPNAVMARIHDRMPVILDAPQCEAWLLAPSQELLVPYAGELAIVPPAPPPKGGGHGAASGSTQLPLI